MDEAGWLSVGVCVRMCVFVQLHSLIQITPKRTVCCKSQKPPSVWCSAPELALIPVLVVVTPLICATDEEKTLWADCIGPKL